LNNLYGVDIDEGATEICKLRLWLSMVADIENDPRQVEPLPNIDFNIRQGNSLIGYTETIQKALFDNTEDGNIATSLTHFSEESIAKRYEEIIDAIKKHKNATSSKEANKWKKVANEKFEEYREDPDKSIYEEFKSNVDEDITLDEVKDYSPFHWVLEFAEVYSKGGFDVIIGNPPWDKVKAERDDFFPRYDEVFRKRKPDDKDEKQTEILEKEYIKDEWEKYQELIKRKASYFNHKYNLQSPEVDGKIESTENDLSALFLERVMSLSNKKSQISLILPGETFTGASRKDLRLHLLENTRLRQIMGFENRGIFEELHYQYKFGIVTFSNSGETDTLIGKFLQTDLDILRDPGKYTLNIPKDVLKKYSPEARIFPNLKNESELNILTTLIRYPPLKNKGESWYCIPYRELDRSKDTYYFESNEEKTDYPVLGGKNIFQYIYKNVTGIKLKDIEFWSYSEERDPEKSAKRRIKEKQMNNYVLVRKIYDEFNGTGNSKTGFVNELLESKGRNPISINDVKLDSSDYRIVFRNSAQPTDERTMIASVIPKGYVCHNAIQTIKLLEINPDEENIAEEPFNTMYKKIFSDKELFVSLGLINSIIFDFIMRTKVDKNIVQYKFKETQVPRLTEGDDWFEYIWTRAAKLNSYGDEFEEMRERLGGIDAETDFEKRKELQAEIDAAAFHAYGLDQEETKFVLDNFHRVENPRLMTEDYFDMVYDKYLMLEEEGPKP